MADVTLIDPKFYHVATRNACALIFSIHMLRLWGYVIAKFAAGTAILKAKKLTSRVRSGEKETNSSMRIIDSFCQYLLAA